MATQPVVPISDSISRALERLFKTGGFALAFGFGEMLFIITANLAQDQLRIPMFILGCVLTLACLAFFLLSSLRTRQVARRIKDDLPLLDTLQRIALQLTDLSALIQAVAFKHLATIQKAIETLTPLVERIPFVGPALRSSGLSDVGKASRLIVDTTDSAKELVRNLEDAIRSGDLKRLNVYASKLDNTLQTLRNLLKARENG